MTNTEPNKASRLIRLAIGAILLMGWLAATILSSDNVVRELAGSSGMEASKQLAATHAIMGISMLLSTITAMTLATMFRRRLVGGWLLFFYISWAGSFIESAMQLAPTLEEVRALQPGSLFRWTMTDDVAFFLSLALLVLAAILLLVRRRPLYARLVAAALIGRIVALLIHQVVIHVYGSETSEALKGTLASINEFIVLAAWYTYFQISKRVQGFTGQSAWTYDWKAGVRPTRLENYYVAARVAGAGIAVLSVSLVLIRLLLPQTAEYFQGAPSAMVALALPPAAKAAVISYFAPISERVRALLIAK